MCGCNSGKRGQAGQPWQVVAPGGAVLSEHGSSAAARIAAAKVSGAVTRQKTAG